MTAAGATRADAAFGANPLHVRWFAARVVSALGGAAPRRVLDIGCGDGSLLLHLADALPRTSFVGVDLSDGNIAEATAAVSRSRHQERIALTRDDYLTLGAGRFDLVVASSSLQAIDATSDALAVKLACDVSAGGRLIHVTPYRCAYNAALNLIRSGLRRVRGAATDRMILTAARVLHPAAPDAMRRERIDYMYRLPVHDEDRLRTALHRHGFRLIATEPAPHTSLGQPKHRFVVMAAPPSHT